MPHVETMPGRPPQMTESFRITLLWLCAGLGGLIVALAPVSAALQDGQYMPIGPDGFYHARRILDAVANLNSFFQFDPNMDAPDGAIVPWPWMYDYVMALIVRAGLALGLSSDPMALLVHIPPVAFLLTIGIALALGRVLRLSLPMQALALFCTAFFPMSQTLYGVGNIDHHFAEHMAVLGSITAAMFWLRHPESRVFAAITGIVMGLAPGIHPAQFILQIPLLAVLAVMWIRNQPRPAATRAFAIALVVATLAVSLPSLPLREGHFDYYTLSWFQVYVAACTAILSVLLARSNFDRKGIIRLGIVSVVMLAPVLGQMLLARDFFTVRVEGMDDISEVQSPLELWRASNSFGYLSSIYTHLLLLVPVTALLCAWKIWRERDPGRLVFWIASLAGIALLSMQLRLQYFGSFALYLPWLLLLDDFARTEWARTRAIKPETVWIATGLVIAFSYSNGVRHYLFERHAPAEDPYYGLTRPVYTPFEAACRENPGIVLAEPNDGHYIRFHTNCPVIANNFLVTERQARRTKRERELLDMSAAEVYERAPEVRYVFVRNNALFYSLPDGSLEFAPDGVEGYHEYALTNELLRADKEHLPPHYRVVGELKATDAKWPYARVFAIDR